ncbi:MAG: ribonuclease domain-containing protein [Pseudomonadota bacterium]
MRGLVRCLWLLALLLAMPYAAAREFAVETIPQIAVAELPHEAQETLRLIRQGGPFPYPRDGIVFGNYEHRLPSHPRGYYREYTVPTPGERNRGARRIVCGQPVECYYSADHYRSFQRIRE